MYVYADYDDINWDEFAHKFRLTFGREMTPDEHRWFHTIWSVVNNNKHEKNKTATA
jgi:hypothetical protein